MNSLAEVLRSTPNLTAAFERACRLHPDRIAVRDRGRSLTYRELRHRVGSIARGLAAAGPAPSGALVAVALEPGADAVCAPLAALRAGYAFLPLDPSAPEDYLAGILADARPHTVITASARAEELGGVGVDIEELAARGRSLPDGPAAGATAQRDDPAYVIFTSGSTGRPKGVVLPHTAMLHSTAARVDAYGVPGRVPLLHSAAVDVYSGVLFWALLTGATLVIGPGGLRDVPATVSLVREEEITDLVYLASLYPAFLDYAAAEPPGALRRVMIGSDRWSEEVIDRHVRVLPEVSLHNEYGPSETAVWTSQACVWNGTAGRRAPLTIGQPVAGTRYSLHTTGGNDTVQEDAGPGELYITGAQLAIGYLNAPKQTARAFVMLPDGTRAYRTGDLAEITDAGDYVFAGRVDRQLKVQGNRIEPAQVEAVLMGHPGVGVAHLVARKASGPGEVLVAYLTPRPGGPAPDANSVRDHAAVHLPRYMVPADVVVLAELPRKPSGKIDEDALPVPGFGQGAELDPPGDALEEALSAAAGEILDCPPPGVTLPLTGYGASSLALMQLGARIARDHHVIVPVSQLFATPSIRQIAAAVRAAKPSDRPPLVATPHPAQGTVLSWQQRQIWFLNKLAPSSLAYNTQCSLHLEGEVDPEALRAALSHVVARHEILRTTFHERSDEPVQTVHAPWDVVLETCDLTALPEPERDAALNRHITAHSARVFDTTRLPLVRWYLYRLGERRWTLFQVEHHFVHDGWSATLLMAEIRDTYAALVDGREPELPALEVQYRDWALWQRHWAASEDFAEQRRYWQHQLQGVPGHGVTFASDRPRPSQQTFNGACLRADIPPETIDALDAVCARHGVTRFAVFLSAFALLVRQHTADDDFVIGSALANRRQAETAPLLGMFVNALPLRLQVTAAQTVGETITRTMEVLLGAQDHQEFPLIEIIKDLGVTRDPSRNPLFQLMFAFHDSPRPDFTAPGMRGRLHIDHNGSAKNDVNVVCVPHPPAPGSGRTHDGVNILWEYNRDLFTAETAQGLLESFGRILTSLADPDVWHRPATALQFLDAWQAHRAAELAAGPTAQPAHTTLHAGVAARTAADPDAVAVVHGKRTLTYQALDSLAARVERQMDAAGVRPGARVMVACGPGFEHVAATVAVLRRGAAFVSVDPYEPASRLTEVLKDASPAAVVCSNRTAAALRDVAGALPLLVCDTATQHPATAAPRPVRVTGADTAYLVYTSGSTGRPKAVVATHTNAVTALTARTVHFGTAPARTLISLPLQFDVATSMVFWTLWNGGTIVFPDKEDVRDPAAVRTLIKDQRITHVNFVASYYQHLLPSLPPGWSSSLRAVAIGGEPCPPGLIRDHARRLPDVTLDNEYGPTEATVWCAAARVHDPDRPSPGAEVTIGRPLANYSLHILDAQLLPRPVGSWGELCVSGPGVTAGYLDRDDLTLGQFVTPDTGPLAGVAVYRTGDEGRLRTDGRFEVSGRLDDQVKIRGYRIELGEVRHAVASHPAVTTAYVVADRQDDPAGRLIAYAAVPGTPQDMAEEVRAWAARRLPAYMVPVVVVVDALPLTATGKVDRQALPAPRTSGRPEREEGQGRLTPVQATVTGVWQDLLPVEHVGLDEEWFALGGDSLTSIRAAARLREEGLPVEVSQILQTGTVRALAALLGNQPDSDTPAAQRRPAGTTVDLTPIQAWFFAQDFAQPHHFNQARLFHIDAAHAGQALRTALQAVVARHDAFRTRFVPAGDGWAGRLDEDAVVHLAEHTVAPEQDGPDPHLLNALHEGLNIGSGKLWAAAVFTDPVGGRHWLFLVMHHLLVDAVSWDIIGRDLTRALENPGTVLPPAPGISGPEPKALPGGAEETYWLRLAQAPKPVLHTAGADRAPYGKLDHLDIRLSAHATAHLDDLSRRGRASITAVLLAALHRALKPMTGNSAPLYTYLEGHGRDALEGADQIVGWCTSLYPVLLTAEHGHDLLAAADGFRRQLADVPRGGTGFAAARYLAPSSQLGTRLAGAAMPEITFNHLGLHGGRRDDVRPIPVRVDRGPTGNPIGTANTLPTALHITSAVDGPAMRLTFAIDTGRFEPGAIEAAATRMVDELERAARLEPLSPAPSRPGARRRPHFLVHPVDGQVHWYSPLADALGTGWDCYGLRADPSQDQAADVPSLASRYVERIQQVQKPGPFTLTGWSFGAPIAFEMARCLEDMGEHVDLLLLDPPPLHTTGIHALAAQVAVLLPDRSPAQIARVVSDAATASGRDAFAAVAAELHIPDSDTFVRERLALLLLHQQALARWRPTGGVRHLHLVQPSTPTDQDPGAWLALGRTTRRTIVPGDHHSILSAGADRLAELYPRPPEEQR
ncbi:amino acid adenylation domain-containing protein [Streptomyces sp. NPDC059783]|uniref:amino acid adenylation domain-containing protein n=1 Tax=Streptomyces sp. NPDC059783 TaxID=3346944 RepID=UPI00364AA5A1